MNRFDSVQAYHTIAGRALEREVIPLLQEQQLGLMVRSALAGGVLTGKFSAHDNGPANRRRAQLDFPMVNKARAFAIVDVTRPIAAASR